MALTPQQTDVLMREVDDAVRQDDLLSFWRRFGKWLVALVIAGLLAFGGWLLWQNYAQGKAEEQSEMFGTLLKSAASGRLDDKDYNKLVDDGSAGYATSATLIKAALAAGKDDRKSAIATYDRLIADTGTPDALRDLAKVRKVALSMDTMKPQAVIDMLKDVAVPGNPWFGSAGEMVGIAYLQMNRKDRAGETFAAISRDATVPETIRMRAGQMAANLGADPATVGTIDQPAKAAE